MITIFNVNEKKGFSMIELLIGLIIFCFTLLAVFGMIISQNKAFKAEDETMYMAQNMRISLDILLRELRMSGYKALEDQFLGFLEDWISPEYLPTYPSTVSLTEGTCRHHFCCSGGSCPKDVYAQGF